MDSPLFLDLNYTWIPGTHPLLGKFAGWVCDGFDKLWPWVSKTRIADRFDHLWGEAVDRYLIWDGYYQCNLPDEVIHAS